MTLFSKPTAPSAFTGDALYQACVPVLVRGLRALAAELRRGTASACARQFDSAVLAQSRLAPDMLTLAAQVQRASDTAKLSAERLCGVPAPKFPDTETTMEELQDRIKGLNQMVDTLQGLVSCCAGDDRPDCPIIADLEEPSSGSALPAPASVGIGRLRHRP